MQPGGSQSAVMPADARAGSAEMMRCQWAESAGTFHSKAWKSVAFVGVGLRSGDC